MRSERQRHNNERREPCEKHPPAHANSSIAGESATGGSSLRAFRFALLRDRLCFPRRSGRIPATTQPTEKSATL